MKLKDKRRLSEVQRSLEVVQEQAGEFIKPEMEFIFVADWDEKEDGKFDASKVVEEEVFGQRQKGIWKHVGKKGHLRYRERAATLVRDITVEEAGSGKFADQAIQAKTDAIAAVKAAASKARDACAVDAPRLSMAALLGMVSGAAASSTEEARKETADSDQATSQAEEASEPESDEDGAAEQDHLRLLGRFGNAQAAGGAKPKPPATSTPKSSPPPKKGEPSQKQTASGQAGSANRKKKSADSDANSTVSHQRSVRAGAGVGQTTFVLDGRGQRLQNAASEVLGKVKAELNTLAFGEEQVGIAHLAGEALQEFQKSIVPQGKYSCRGQGPAAIFGNSARPKLKHGVDVGAAAGDAISAKQDRHLARVCQEHEEHPGAGLRAGDQSGGRSAAMVCVVQAVPAEALRHADSVCVPLW